ncbi:MAG TPA: triose-phosphate isomerase [Rhizomicrobium sp.]|jgi:triosephosphate isomerase|nr:triose-phosphate isomerase [Rhizomicrobium sp.]
MRQLIAGNWKMNGLGAALAELEALARALAARPAACDVLICPPATLIARAAAAASGSAVAIGGQDCRAEASGAFTGDVSAEMLRDAGATAVIVGHSERRQYHAETDAIVAAKARAAWRAGLTAIVCIGESEAERDAGDAYDVCSRQLAGSVPAGATPANTAIAYEPIWAIGTGKTASVGEIGQIHAHIKASLAAPLRILYGGSVKPTNAKEILGLADVGGALVGGASLKADDFLTIVAASRDGS